MRMSIDEDDLPISLEKVAPSLKNLVIIQREKGEILGVDGRVDRKGPSGIPLPLFPLSLALISCPLLSSAFFHIRFLFSFLFLSPLLLLSFPLKPDSPPLSRYDIMDNSINEKVMR
jgi:hypothetical protein